MRKRINLFIFIILTGTNSLVFAQTPIAPQPMAPQQPLTTVITETTAVDQKTPIDIEFILDASGSMIAKVGTETQMDIAKQSIKNTVASIPSSANVALRVYAHRVPKAEKEKSCVDTELLIPFGPSNIAALTAAIDPIQPNGYTPIAYSLKTAATDFIGKESQYVIILVSDGEETCGGDPVAEAKNLLAQGFKVTIHTIGFRVDEKAKAQLTAISSATGGMYFDASDAATLTQNLQQVTQKALLVNKPAETVRGQEIKGGNQYAEAVQIMANIEYRLDHHQKVNQYDYFYFEAKKGQIITASIATQDKGVVATSETQARETDSPYAGMRLVDGELKELVEFGIIAGRHAKQERLITSATDQRIYVLSGSSYDAQHKNSTFKLAVAQLFDANSGQDAGDDLPSAITINIGDYPENSLYSDQDSDFFRFEGKKGEIYSFVVTPLTTDPYLRLEVLNPDRILMGNKNPANAGAVLRLEGLKAEMDGPITVHVSGYAFGSYAKYSLKITKESANDTVFKEETPVAKSPVQKTPTQGVAPAQTLAQTPIVKTPAGSTQLKFLTITLGLAGFAILILLIAVVVLLLKKKK